jgi:hypothetical protein
MSIDEYNRREMERLKWHQVEHYLKHVVDPKGDFTYVFVHDYIDSVPWPSTYVSHLKNWPSTVYNRMMEVARKAKVPCESIDLRPDNDWSRPVSKFPVAYLDAIKEYLINPHEMEYVNYPCPVILATQKNGWPLQANIYSMIKKWEANDPRWIVQEGLEKQADKFKITKEELISLINREGPLSMLTRLMKFPESGFVLAEECPLYDKLKKGKLRTKITIQEAKRSMNDYDQYVDEEVHAMRDLSEPQEEQD